MELNQKLTKARSIRGVYTQEKYLCKNLGIKRGEDVCSKGAYFRELVVCVYICMYVYMYTHPSLAS